MLYGALLYCHQDILNMHKNVKTHSGASSVHVSTPCAYLTEGEADCDVEDHGDDERQYAGGECVGGPFIGVSHIPSHVGSLRHHWEYQAYRSNNRVQDNHNDGQQHVVVRLWADVSSIVDVLSNKYRILCDQNLFWSCDGIDITLRGRKCWWAGHSDNRWRPTHNITGVLTGVDLFSCLL